MEYNSNKINQGIAYNYTYIICKSLLKFGRYSSHSGFEKSSDGCSELQSTTDENPTSILQFQNNYTGVHFNIVTIEVHISYYSLSV